MADGAYERRGPREAEIAHLKRLLAEQSKGRAACAPDNVKDSSEAKLPV